MGQTETNFAVCRDSFGFFNLYCCTANNYKKELLAWNFWKLFIKCHVHLRDQMDYFIYNCSSRLRALDLCVTEELSGFKVTREDKSKKWKWDYITIIDLYLGNLDLWLVSTPLLLDLIYNLFLILLLPARCYRVIYLFYTMMYWIILQVSTFHR